MFKAHQEICSSLLSLTLRPLLEMAKIPFAHGYDSVDFFDLLPVMMCDIKSFIYCLPRLLYTTFITIIIIIINLNDRSHAHMW